MKYTRNSLNLSTRLEIGCLVAQNKGVYGYVTALSLKYWVSRWFIYFSCYHLWLSVLQYAEGAESVGLAPVNRSLEEKIFCLYLETHSSLEGIQRVLATLDGHKMGIGRISEVLTKAGRVLPIRDQGGQEKLWVLLIDEIFTQGMPILVSVDASSCYIYEIRLASNCNQATWKESLKALGVSEGDCLIVGDQGKGLRCAAEACGVYQSDHFHALKPFKKLLGDLEKRAYAAIEREWKEEKEVQKAPQGQKHPTQKQGEFCTMACEQAITNHEQYRYLLRELQMALEWIDWQQGRFKSKEEIEQQIEGVLALMSELAIFDLEEKIASFKKLLPDLLTYLQNQATIEAQLKLLFSEEIYYQAFLRGYAAKQRAYRIKSTWGQKYFLKDAHFWQEALKEDLGEEAFKEISSQAEKLLDSMVRASSIVEMINSLLRPYLDQARSQITQERLNLIRFFLNRSIFRRGKRQGSSPLQLLTGRSSPNCWIEELQQILGTASTPAMT